MTEAEFKFHMDIWGWSDDGPRSFAAKIAEDNFGFAGYREWDNPLMLKYATIIEQDGTSRPVPDWNALPWVTEHLMRGHSNA